MQFADTHDATEFSSTWQQRLPDRPGASFDLLGYLDSATLPLHPTTAGAVGTTVAFTLLQDSTIGYTGTGVIRGINIVVAHDGAADVSLSADVDGTLYRKTS